MKNTTNNDKKYFIFGKGSYDELRIPKKWVYGLILGIAAFVGASTGVSINNPTEVSVISSLGNISSVNTGGGINFKLPFFLSSATKYNTTIQSIRCEDSNQTCKSLDAATKDLQSVKASIQVSYRIDASKPRELYQLVSDQDMFTSTIIPSTVEEAFKVSTAQFSAEELVTKREQVKEIFEKELSERLDKFFLKVAAVNIVDFKFNNTYEDAINRKVVLEQEILQKKQELEKVKVDREIDFTKAETVNTIRIKNAQSEAEQYRLQAEALRSNPLIIELEKLKKWNGVLPQVQGNSGTIIDLGSSTKAN